MKVAIPTNDGINISDHFYNTQSFKVFTIEKGTIINEELRTAEDTPMIENKIDLVSDCDVYIIDNDDTLETTFISEGEKIIEKTCNSIITNIIVDYKNEQQRIESNTFCCP
jgi:hypothetical protein